MLTHHSRDSTVLMFGKSGPTSLGMRDVTIEKLFSYLTLRESQTGSQFLDLAPQSAMHFKFLVSPPFWLIGKCNTMYRKYFHRNLCPEELGFMLLMNFLTTPLAWRWPGTLQCGLPPGRRPTSDSFPSRSKLPKCPTHFSLHSTSSPSSSKASQLLQHGKPGLSVPLSHP